MQTFSAAQAQAFIFTRREGVLGRLGHDLKLAPKEFTARLDPDAGTLEVDVVAPSVAVVCAVKDGRDAPGTLSAGDLRDIGKNLHNAVLDSARFPSITLRLHGAKPVHNAVTGTAQLTLRGVTRDVAVQATHAGNTWSGHTTFQQSTFGIKPFTAMMGALAVRDEIRVTLVIPA